MPETTLYIRIKQALNWLKRNKGILQKDIADKMGMAEASFTRALMRTKEKNDEDFVIAFHSVTSEFFSLDYLLNGNGNLVVVDNKQADNSQRNELSAINTSMDFSIYIEKAVEKATAYADKIISTLEKQLKEKDDMIAANNKIIRLLEQRVEYLESMQQIKDTDDPLHDYPFPIGVADQDDINPSRV